MNRAEMRRMKREQEKAHTSALFWCRKERFYGGI